MIVFTVPGNPVGKGRPRVSSRGGFSRMYTPEKTVSYESLVGYSAAQAMAGATLLDGPVAVTLAITVPIPASWSKKKQAAALAGTVLPTTKPDIDNVEKAIFDGLNGVVWKDDVQVVEVSKRKRYGEQPGVAVQINPLAVPLSDAPPVSASHEAHTAAGLLGAVQAYHRARGERTQP